MPEGEIKVELAYATPDRQLVISVSLPLGSTVQDALNAVKIHELCPELDRENLITGVFSKVCGMNRPLKAGDRVEIYRPLVNNPKETRRQRAYHK